MHSARGVDKLPGDTYSVSCFAHTAFEHIPHSQLAPDLLHIDSSALVGEAGVPGDDEKTTEVGQRRNNFLDDTIRKIRLVMLAAQVIKWEDSNGRFAGRRKGFSCA